MILTYYCIITMIIIAYLLGSIPSAVWIGKKYYGIDIREHGSKNAGTTNMLRVLGRRAALPVFLLDFLKGFVAVTLTEILKYDAYINDMWLINIKIIAVFAAVLGHISPFSRDSGAARGGDPGRGDYGYLSAGSTALLRRMGRDPDDDALRFTRLDRGRLLLSGLHDRFAQSEPIGAFHRLLVRHGRSAALHPPQKYRSAEKRHGIQNIHLEAPSKSGQIAR